MVVSYLRNDNVVLVKSEPKFDITITLNGESYKGKLSKETLKNLGLLQEEQ